MTKEFDLIEAIKRKIPRHLQGEIPIGDDAASLSLQSGKKTLLTTDVIVEGVDFLFEKIRPEMAGRKALAINLSDFAAMGAEPTAFLVTLGISSALTKSWILRFYKGMMDLAKQYNVKCVGGDITRAKDIFASIALIGEAKPEEIIRRAGARNGDWIAVTGVLGGSILKHHYSFEPRIKEARFLTRRFRPTSMIDISDGLIQDLEHILKASGVSAEMDLDQIPISQAASGLKQALTDGEDFELLFTIPAHFKATLEKEWPRQFPKVRLSWIGRVRSGKTGIRFRSKGKPVLLKFKKKGYQHF